MTFLRDERIHAVPKTVEELDKDGSLPVVSTVDYGTFIPAIADIRDRIERGVPLDLETYRQGTQTDVLLRDEGIMHLHVAPNIDNDVLLLVGQTDDTVLFIALVRHADVFSPPNYSRGIKRWLGSLIFKWSLRR